MFITLQSNTRAATTTSVSKHYKLRPPHEKESHLFYKQYWLHLQDTLICYQDNKTSPEGKNNISFLVQFLVCSSYTLDEIREHVNRVSPGWFRVCVPPIRQRIPHDPTRTVSNFILRSIRTFPFFICNGKACAVYVYICEAFSLFLLRQYTPFSYCLALNQYCNFWFHLWQIILWFYSI